MSRLGSFFSEARPEGIIASNRGEYGFVLADPAVSFRWPQQGYPRPPTIAIYPNQKT